METALTTNQSAPVAVVGLENGVAEVVTGFWHTCALTTGGDVVCWGDNAYGQLGDGMANSNQFTPTPFGESSEVA